MFVYYITYVRATDALAVEWRKDDKVIHSLDLVQKTGLRVQIGNAYTLTFSQVRLEDSGMYTCYVSFYLSTQYYVTGKQPQISKCIFSNLIIQINYLKYNALLYYLNICCNGLLNYNF